MGRSNESVASQKSEYPSNQKSWACMQPIRSYIELQPIRSHVLFNCSQWGAMFGVKLQPMRNHVSCLSAALLAFPFDSFYVDRTQLAGGGNLKIILWRHAHYVISGILSSQFCTPRFNQNSKQKRMQLLVQYWFKNFLPPPNFDRKYLSGL